MIGSLLSRISDAEKLTPQQLQQTVKNKVLPAGIASMISQDDATKKTSAPAQPPQGTVVSKIMEEADKALSPEDKIMQKINLIKQDIGEIQEGVQSGEIKAYEGIPIIKEKVAELGKLQAMLQPPPQIPQMPPPQQMALPQPQGIDSAESNLPTEMASGGIVGFAEGGVPIELHGTADVSGQGGGSFGGQQGGFGGYGGGYKGYGAGVQERAGGGFAPQGGPQNSMIEQMNKQLQGALTTPRYQDLQPQVKPLQQNIREVSPAYGSMGIPSAQNQALGTMPEPPPERQFQEPQVGQPIYNLLGRNGLPETGIPQQYDLSGGKQYGAPPVAQPPMQDISLANQGMLGQIGAQPEMYKERSERLGSLFDTTGPRPYVPAPSGPNDPQYAKGGVVGYARGSIIDEEEDDNDLSGEEDYQNALKMHRNAQIRRYQEQQELQSYNNPMGEGIGAAIMAAGRSSKPSINATPSVEQGIKKDQGGIHDIINSKAQKYNLPPSLMHSIAKAESNFNPNAGNPHGAKGLYQFLDKTWAGMGGKQGEQFDPDINSELGAKYIRQNAEFLKGKLGRDPKYSEVYGAHFFGPTGAASLLSKAKPDMPIEQGLATFESRNRIKTIMNQNPNLRGKTVGQVFGDLESKTGQGIVSLANGGQIKHFVGGNVVTDDYRSNYDRIFGKNPAPTIPPMTTEEILNNLKQAKNSQGQKPVVSPSSASRNAPLSGGITEVFNALRGGQSNVSKAVLGSGDRNTYPGMSDLNYYNELLAKSKEDPTYTPYQDEMKKLLASNPDLLKNNTVTPDLRGPLANVAKPSPLLNVQPNVPVKAPVNPNAAIIPPAADTSYLGDDTNTEIGGLMTPFTPRAEEKEPAAQDKEKATYSFEDYLKDQQAQREGIRGKKEEDKYMSLLAAGLGMMSGTSPYAAANIGKGALAGVQDYRDTQKQRAAELASIDKNMLGAYRYGSLDKYYASLGLSKEEKDKLAKETLEEKRLNRQDVNQRYNMGLLQKMDEAAKNKALADAKLSPMQLQTMSPEAIAAITAAGAQKYLNTPQYRKLYKETWDMDPFENSGGPSVLRFDSKGNPVK